MARKWRLTVPPTTKVSRDDAAELVEMLKRNNIGISMAFNEQTGCVLDLSEQDPKRSAKALGSALGDALARNESLRHVLEELQRHAVNSDLKAIKQVLGLKA
jgi:hypothetical protein